MSNVAEAAALFRDLGQVLVLDRLDPKRVQTSKNAGAHCRKLRFHSRCKIRSLPWPDLFQRLGLPSVNEISIPSPAVNNEDVGDADYYAAIATLVRAIRPKLIFEFGTYLGVGTVTMAANSTPDCRIYTLDLPDSAMAQGEHQLNATDTKHVVKSRSRVGEAFVQTPYQSRIAQIRDDSLTFRAENTVTNVDLVFVDGGHSTPLITKDTENAFRILSPTGIILWDDYFHAYPDVVNFLDKLADDYSLSSIPGTNLVIYGRRWDDSK
jgi:predicted O-methyltransferase YrrM